MRITESRAVEMISTKYGLSKAKTKELIKDLFTHIKSDVNNGSEILIYRFGKFKTYKSKATVVFGKPVPEKIRVKFAVSKEFQETNNN